MEAIHLKLFEADYTSPVEKFDAGCNIFQIDQYYKPNTHVQDVFPILLSLKPETLNDEQIKSLKNVAEQVMKFVDSKNEMANMTFGKIHKTVLPYFQQNGHLYIQAW